MADSFFSTFKGFLIETNAIALAIAVVMGGAISKLVTTLVSALFMPVLGVILPGGEWRQWKVTLSGTNAIGVGEIIGATMDFVIISFIIFILAAKIFKIEVKKG